MSEMSFGEIVKIFLNRLVLLLAITGVPFLLASTIDDSSSYKKDSPRNTPIVIEGKMEDSELRKDLLEKVNIDLDYIEVSLNRIKKIENNYGKVVKMPQYPKIKAPNDFVDAYKDIAIKEMNRTGIPASITLAQAIHESGWGSGTLAQSSNNYFGIKCKQEWTGPTYYIKDDELDGEGKLLESCFRAYANVEDSFIDHSNYLLNNPRYKSIFVNKDLDYVSLARELAKAGYATDVKYSEKLIANIEKYKLDQYDNVEDYQLEYTKIDCWKVKKGELIYRMKILIDIEDRLRQFEDGELSMENFKLKQIDKSNDFSDSKEAPVEFLVADLKIKVEESIQKLAEEVQKIKVEIELFETKLSVDEKQLYVTTDADICDNYIASVSDIKQIYEKIYTDEKGNKVKSKYVLELADKAFTFPVL